MSIYDKSSLVLIPSGTKTGKVYSQKPVSGDGDFTFTRSSAATRVNADGFIEKETQNNVLQSNTFSSATWIKQQSGGTTPVVTSGFTDPYGGSNAWRLQCSISGGLYSMISQGLSTTGLNCNSIWIKSNTGSNQDVYFRINNADQSTTRTATTEWQRIEVFTDAVGQSFTIGVRSPATGATSSCDVLIYAAQSNQGLIAQEVITTTTTAVEGGITDNVPRLDYTDSSCPALLLEPQRTNEIVHSEYIAAGVTWSAASGITTESNSILSPEGVINGTKLIRPANSNVAWIRKLQSVTIGQNQVFSVFAKEGNEPVLNLTYYDTTDGDRFFNFNLSTQAISGNGLSHATYVDSGIEDYSNGWYRCYIVVEARGASIQLQIGVGANRGAAPSEYLYIYGAQHEQNSSYVSSYIPTYGSSVTRLLDNPYILSQSSLIGQTEGTVYAELKSSVTSPAGSFFISVSDGTSNNRILIGYAAASNSFRVVVIFSGVSNGGNNYAITDSTDFVKVAVKYTASSVDVFIDGVKQTSQSGGSFNATLNKITFDNGTGGNKFEGSVKQRFIFTTAINDQEAIDLTTI